MIIFKILGCIFVFSMVVVCIRVSLAYYASRRGEIELSRRKERLQIFNDELEEIQESLDQAMEKRHSGESVEKEWEEHNEQLREWHGGSSYEEDGLLSLIWLIRNSAAEEWKLCPELCQRRKELNAYIESEREAISLLEKMAALSQFDYEHYKYWRKYHKKQNKA